MEDIIQLPTCDSDSGSEGEEACKSSNQHGKGEVEGKSMSTGTNDSEKIMDDPGIEEGQLMSETEITRGVIDDSSCLHERVVLAETQVLDYVVLRATDVIDDAEVEEGQLLTETENGETFSVGRGDITEDVTKEGKNVSLPSENGGVTEHETSNSYPKTDGGSISGVKRTRQTSEDQQPSVHVKYYDLSRQSKRKLEQLLREWSEWSMKNGSRCLEDQDEVSESGEEIYFPALQVGKGKTSAVSFWMENEIKKPQGKDFVPVEDGSVPLYDRGFALGSTSAEGSNIERGLGLLDAPRCFNCGSYSHSLKECTKPRDIVAVNNSRKQLKSKRNQTAGMRNLTRYYQDSPGGKYEGLRPGVLAAETRRLLGLGEFDPPPWLNRMREIGYPPGYLEADDENLPSGIAIYADEDMKVDTEEGEILEAETTDLPRKMSVKIPGINTPIPENAEERLWAARPANSERHRNGDSGRSNHYSESSTRGRYREYSSRDLKDDDPHGFDRASRYPPRSPSFRKSPSDRERNDPLDSEDSPAFRLYNSFSYNASRRSSEHSSSLDEYPDYSSRSRDRSDRHRHRSGR